MRPTEDLAYRARNWFWYWRVRAISGLSNDRLDQKCFGDQRRRRHFERIQASASAPDEVAIVGGETLLAIVDGWDRSEDGGPGPYESATRAFNSPLWDFLAIRDQEPSVYSDFIQQFTIARGWMRAQTHDHDVCVTFLGRDEPAVEGGVSTAYSAMLHKLVNDVSPDALAVLIALFRESMHQVNLEQAVAIRTALTTAIGWMGEQLGMDENVTQITFRLVKDRVLTNRWITEADWRKYTDTPLVPGITSRARIREFQAWVTWYTRRPQSFDSTGYGLFPIVPRSVRTDWLWEQRDFLGQVHKEAFYLRNTVGDFKDSWDPALQQIAAKAQIRAKEILSNFSPPDCDAARFYTTTKPNIVMGNLPLPYSEKCVSTARRTNVDEVDAPHGDE